MFLEEHFRANGRKTSDQCSASYRDIISSSNMMIVANKA